MNATLHVGMNRVNAHTYESSYVVCAVHKHRNAAMAHFYECSCVLQAMGFGKQCIVGYAHAHGCSYERSDSAKAMYNLQLFLHRCGMANAHGYGCSSALQQCGMAMYNKAMKAAHECSSALQQCGMGYAMYIRDECRNAGSKSGQSCGKYGHECSYAFSAAICDKLRICT
jgi:hypothetical protein